MHIKYHFEAKKMCRNFVDKLLRVGTVFDGKKVEFELSIMYLTVALRIAKTQNQKGFSAMNCITVANVAVLRPLLLSNARGL